MITQYRSDIDGLRAVAVGGVVIFHAFPTLLPGGFIGVDVFFVLSGYLITSIIASEAAAGRFSLAGFYERRFRRILPALLAMLVVTTIAALLILPPGELAAYGRSLIGVAVFASNIIFWRESGYFDVGALDKPLLHTWSLAVEEQFYIIWPLVAAGLVAVGRRRLLQVFVWIAIIVSFAAAVIAVQLAPSQAFYMLPYRAWELGFGALLAVGAVPALRTSLQREVAAWTGMLLILVPMLVYSEATPFPGLAALPPCLGTLLVIHAGQGSDTKVGRALSVRPILYTGLISYSFYLWHWPLLVLPRIALGRELAVPEAALAVAAAFVLAALSLRFVEKPFRGQGTFRLTRRQIMLGSGASFALFGAIGVAAWKSNGFEQFASPGVRLAEQAIASVNPLRAACHNDAGTGTLGPLRDCTRGRPDPRGGYQVLLWGDSHADHLAAGLMTLGKSEGFSFRQASVSGCSPLAMARPKSRPGCVAFHRAALAEAAGQPDLRAIVISVRWATALPGIVRNAGSPEAGLLQFRATIGAVLRETRATVGPRATIILVGSTPEFSFWPATCLARAAKMGRDGSSCRVAEAADAKWSPIADRELTALNGSGVVVVLPRDAFCRATRCRTTKDDDILFRDDDHLTNAGSSVIARQLAPLLRDASRFSS